MSAPAHGRRLALALGLGLGAAILVVALLVRGLSGALLNGYVKGKLERAFAAAHPGCALRIGALDYAFGANRLVSKSVTMKTPDSTFAVDRVALAGVRWTRLMLGRAAPAEVFAKASLEANVRFLAADLGPKGIRVNAISAGPIKTLAARGVGALGDMLKSHAERAPLHRNVDQSEVGGTALYLASDLASAVTGEVIYVDCGYNIMGF